MNSRLLQGFYLGDVLIEPLLGQVTGKRGSRHLPPKAIEVLLCLARSPGTLVTRDDLLAEVWGPGQGSQEALVHAISDLRQALGDHAGDPQYVQTLPKRGYRLVTEIQLLGDSEPTVNTTTAPHKGSNAEAAGNNNLGSEQRSVLASFWADLSRRNVIRIALAYLIVAWLLIQIGDTIFDALLLPKWSLTLLLAIITLGFPVALLMAWVFEVTPAGVVIDKRKPKIGNPSVRRNLDAVIIGALAIVVVVLGYRVFRPPDVEFTEVSGIQIPLPDNSIAVLRFLSIGGESYFADGLCEELLDKLAKMKELGIAARTSSWAFSEGEADVRTIAEQLEVNYVLEGSVRQVGDRIKVTAQLNDGPTGKHVWSQTYDRELTTANFFATQTEIARKVVNLLKITLSPESRKRLEDKPQTSMEALILYLQGQEYFRQPHSDETLDTAAKLFKGALEIDPQFAMAYAGLCENELSRYVITREVAVFAEAERACHRALTLGEDMPRVLAALGSLYLFSGQNDKAADELLRAIDKNPNLIDAYADLGEALENLGRVQEAERAFGAMVARQPGYWYAYNALGNFLYRQSRYDEALGAWTTVTELAPDRALGYNNVAIAHYMMGQFDEASIAYEMSAKIEPYVDNYSNLGLAYFYAGQYEKAGKMQMKASKLRPEDARVLGRLATARYFGGRADEAKVLFEQAITLIKEQLVINPNDVRLNRYLAVFGAILGRLEESQAAIERALALRPESSGVRYDAAKVALATGDVETAINYLEQAQKLGYSTNIIAKDPFFDVLHQNERFRTIADNNEQGAGK